MFLYVFAKGENLKNPYDWKNDFNDAVYIFEYYRKVFDASDDFERLPQEDNCITYVEYISKNGCKVILDIDFCFPCTELSHTTLEVDRLSNELVNDIACAFGKYHETTFTHFNIDCSGEFNVNYNIFASIQLFEKDPQLLKLNSAKIRDFEQP